MMATIKRTLLVAALMVLAAMQFGCGSSVPDTPDGTVDAVAKGIANKQPDIVWEAMPESYKKDVNDLIHRFASKMDKEVHAKAFAVMGDLETLLTDKKEFILNSDMVRQSPLEKDKLEANYDQFVAIFSTIANSELADLEDLQSADGGDILEGTGRELMQSLAALSASSEDDEMNKELKKLSEIKIEKVSGDDKTAKLKVTVGDKEEEVELVKVEDRWVPKEMADSWDDQMVKMKEGIDEMAEAMSKNKVKTMQLLGGLQTTIQTLNSAENQDQFNEYLKQAQQEMMGSLPPLLGGGGPGMPF